MKKYFLKQRENGISLETNVSCYTDDELVSLYGYIMHESTNDDLQISDFDGFVFNEQKYLDRKAIKNIEQYNSAVTNYIRANGYSQDKIEAIMANYSECQLDAFCENKDQHIAEMKEFIKVRNQAKMSSKYNLK